MTQRQLCKIDYLLSLIFNYDNAPSRIQVLVRKMKVYQICSQH